MKISLTKVPVNVGKESIQKLYIEIHDDKATLLLPLSSGVTQEEYEKALQNFYNACDTIMDLWNTRKIPIDFYFLPLSLLHKMGAKLYPYSDIIALLIFMFPKMNNFLLFYHSH